MTPGKASSRGDPWRTKRGARHCLTVLFPILFLLLCSCAQGVADGDLDTAVPTIRPTEITGARWIVDRTLSDLDGSRSDCRCSEPGEIAHGFGVPDAPSDDCAVVCLGGRGFLIARMSATFTNRSGDDLIVHEWGDERGGENEPFSIYVSGNGHDWLLVAESVENDPGSTFASVDLGEEHGHYLYVKIVPDIVDGRGFFDGPEILAIEALHPLADFGS